MSAIDKVSESIQKLISMFESGNLPPAIARTMIHQKNGDNTKPSDRWSLGNRILMLLEGTEDARGYNQWQAVGRKVKKGAKAFYILGPMYGTKKVKKKEIIDGEETVREEEVTVLIGFKGIPVFRYEDTEGDPLKQVDYTPKALPPLINVAQKYGIKVEYSPCLSRFYGYYAPGENKIVLCTHDVITFFHELAHAVHNGIRPLVRGQDADQEIVAETVAAVLCVMYGYEGYTYEAYRYVSHYAQRTDNKKVVQHIMRVLSDIEKVLDIILSTEEEEKNKVA